MHAWRACKRHVVPEPRRPTTDAKAAATQGCANLLTLQVLSILREVGGWNMYRPIVYASQRVIFGADRATSKSSETAAEQSL